MVTTMAAYSPLRTLINGHCILNNNILPGYVGPVGHIGGTPYIAHIV